MAKTANIKSSNWILNDVEIYDFEDGVLKKDLKSNYTIRSIYNYNNIISLFNNSDTFSFFRNFN